MKRFRVMAAALCAAVLLCGFSVPAYAFADGGEGADYGDPTMTEETPAPEPEPTIEPGEGFSEEGNLVTRDLLYDAHTNKQFSTVQTAGGNTFYISLASWVLGILSLILAVCGLFELFIQSNPQWGITGLVLAFLLSPFGLPAAAEWLVCRLDDLTYSLKTFIAE